MPLDVFHIINHIYEINKNKLDKANQQLVGKIEDEHSLFYHGQDQTKIKWLEGKIEKEEDEYKATKYQIDLDECRFGKASMEKVARHRMSEIKMWSKLKKEFNDGSFNDKDVNQHQLESYGIQYAEKAKSLNANSNEAEIFNVMGQLQSLQRIKKSGELESSYKELDKITNDDKPKD